MIQVIRQPSDSNLEATFLGHDPSQKEVEKPVLAQLLHLLLHVNVFSVLCFECCWSVRVC
jgi:hypothetical protein